MKRLFGLDYRPRVQVRRAWERLGTEYGGYAVCPDGLGSGSIVYSFGVGEDISFDLELISKWGAEVFAFDPTPRSIAWVRSQELPPGFHFYGYGVSNGDGAIPLYTHEDPTFVSCSMLRHSRTTDKAVVAEVRRVSTIQKMLSHARIDVLKLDIEGAEYCVIKDVLASGVDVGQILVEFHDRLLGGGHKWTRRAVSALNAHRYRVFCISEDATNVSFVRT